MTCFFQRYNDPPAPSLEELKSRQKKAAPTLEELKNKPKSNVPWTRKGNAQPVKKEILAEEKEVKEFESCRKTLKDNVKIESSEKNTRNMQAVKKNETTAPAVEESNEEVEIESGKSCEKVKMVDNEEKTEINAVEVAAGVNAAEPRRFDMTRSPCDVPMLASSTSNLTSDVCLLPDCTRSVLSVNPN